MTYLTDKNDLPPTPWKKWSVDRPVIILLITGLLYNYIVYILNNGFPKYLNDVLHIPIDRNSTYNAVSRLITMFVSVFTGFLCDWMHKKHNISTETIRKTFVGLSTVIPGIFSILATYGACDEALVVPLMIISILAQGFDVAGLILNVADLAPNYAGPMNAALQTMFSASAIFAPYTIGVLTPNVNNNYGLSSSDALLLYSYSQFGALQPWNSSPKTNPKAQIRQHVAESNGNV